MEKAKLRSGKFFRQRWTNCPPQAVVAAFGFANALLRCVHASASAPLLEAPVDAAAPLASEVAVFSWLADEASSSAARACERIAADMGDVTMKSFAEHYTTEECDHWDLQVALYVQALMHPTSKTRRQGLPSLRNSRAIVCGAAGSVRAFNYRKEVLAKVQRLQLAFMRGNAEAKRQLQLRAQQEFLATHGGVAKVFTHAEIQRLNATRPQHDQIELTQGGLPRHHCAFEKVCMHVCVCACVRVCVCVGGGEKGRHTHTYARTRTRTHTQTQTHTHTHMKADTMHTVLLPLRSDLMCSVHYSL